MYKNLKIYSSSYSVFCSSVTKSCLTLCDPIDCSIAGFAVLHFHSVFNNYYIPEILNILLLQYYEYLDFPGGASGKESSC